MDDLKIMAALIGAGGTIGAALIAGVFAYSGKLGKIKDGIQNLISGQDRTNSMQERTNSKQDNLSLDHQKILNGQLNIEKRVLDGQIYLKDGLIETRNAVSTLNTMLVEKKHRRNTNTKVWMKSRRQSSIT